jgi:molybdate transport system regulatory protein
MTMAYKVKSRIWLELNGKLLLGPGRVKLLRAIEKTGSLSKAAKALEMSYKKAWRVVDEVNKAAKTPVVITQTGGKNGGGTVLTPHGLEVLDAFEQINQDCWQYLDQQPINIEI